MKLLIEVYAYIKGNWYGIVLVVGAVLTLAEAIVRVTPTKKDDGAVERVGKWLRSAFDMASTVFPNLKKGGGKHPTLKEKESNPVVEKIEEKVEE